jgi:type IV secretory pathway VirB9-like protein
VNEVRYAWEDGRADVVQVGIGYPTIVRFEPGEHISSLMDGDRAPVTETEPPQTQQPTQDKTKQANCFYGIRWQMCKGVSETQYTPVEHLAVTATHAGHKQGVVVFTDRRAYYLELQAVRTTPTRLVSWTYPTPPPVAPPPPEPRLLPEQVVPRQYHIGYTTTQAQGTPEWAPLAVWSDLPTVPAAKLYLQFPPTVLHQRMPLLRGMNELGKPYLLNSRQYGTWVVVDELAPRLELRRGAGDDAQVVVVTREQLRTIACPGDAQCPRFP